MVPYGREGYSRSSKQFDRLFHRTIIESKNKQHYETADVPRLNRFAE